MKINIDNENKYQSNLKLFFTGTEIKKKNPIILYIIMLLIVRFFI